VVQPEIHIFGITLQSFGLMLALAFVVSFLATARYLKEMGRPVDWAYEAVFAALVGGVAGSRLWWIAEHWSQAKGDLIGSLFSGSGLVFHGGVLGGAIAVLAWAWRKGVFDLRTVDLAAVPLAAGYAIGRIGCQLAGDGDYGKNWDGPWAMTYPHGTVPTTIPVHPTPIYETLIMGVVALLLWRWRHRWRPGTLFALWLVLAGVERFLIEFLRRNPAELLGLTQPQLVSIVMVAGGGAWLWLRRNAQPVPAVQETAASSSSSRTRRASSAGV
jgi:phosphatidylglycerol---prolipoprotein diacylglyceryl transferase